MLPRDGLQHLLHTGPASILTRSALQAILGVTGETHGHKLGIDTMCAAYEVQRWRHKFSKTVKDALEQGLKDKSEGLNQVRRDRVPQVRTYDVSEYYYKARRCSLQ